MANQVDIIIRAVDKGVKRAFSGMVTDVKRSKLALDAFNATLQRTNKAAGMLTGRLSAAFAGVGLGVVSRSLGDAGIQAQRLNLAFEAIDKSSSGAAAELGYVRGEAERLGLVFYETADSYKQIFAAGSAGNVKLEDTRRIFRGMAEAASALGMTEEQATGSFRALGQMMGKNKVLAEELRTQMGEKLPTAIQFMAEAFGGTVAELERAMANGEIGVETLIKFSDILHEKYGPAAEEAGRKAIGILNRWKTAWWDLKVLLSNSGFLEESTSQLKRMTETLTDPAVQAAIKVWAERFFEVAGAVVKMAWEWKEWIAGAVGAAVVTSLLTRIVGMVLAVSNGMRVLLGMRIGVWFASLATGITGATVAAGGLTAALGLAAGATLALIGGYRLGEWLVMREHWKGIADEAERLNRATRKTAAKFLEISRATGVNVTSMEDLDRAVAEGKIHYDELTKEWVAGSREMLAATRNSSSAQVTSTKTATKEMESAYKKYVDEIKKLQDDIGERSRNLAAELREMGRSGMSDYNAWQDRKREAQEYEAAARSAMQAGNFDEAVKWADAAKEAYADLNEEVQRYTADLIAAKQAQAKQMRDSGWSSGSYREYLQLQKEIAALQQKAAREGAESQTVAVSGSKALKTAMDGVKRSGELAATALQRQKTAAEEAADALNKEAGYQMGEAFTEAAKQAKELADVSGGFEKDWGVAFINMGEEAAAQIDAIDRNLNEMARDRTVKIKIIETKSGGGAVGMHLGGMVRTAIRKMAAGGSLVRSAMNGMYFPGYGGGDRPKNLVMAEDGEVMIRKEMVKRAGLRAALAFNSGRFDILLSELMARFNPGGIIKRQLGGMVAQAMPVSNPLFMSGGGFVAGGGGGGMVELSLDLPVPGPPVKMSVEKGQLAELDRQITRARRLRS